MAEVLSVERIVDINNDLEEGMGVTHISRKYGIAKNTVYRIKNGVVTPENRERYKKQSIDKITDLNLFWRPYTRCKGCGNKVQKPCLLCALRTKDWKSISILFVHEEHV